MLDQGNYFVVSVKLNFCQRHTHCIDDQDKVQSLTDTDNEFIECQTPGDMKEKVNKLVRLRETMEEKLKIA